MGGSVGLKGTDGEMYDRALELGAAPVSPARTREFLEHLTCADRLRLLVAPGAMGEDYAIAFEYRVVGRIDKQSTPADTRAIAAAMIDAGAELIVFAGGDGTARDMMDAVDLRVPVIAIPAGVKIYSSVFAYSPRAAAELLDAFVEDAALGEEEVLDIDEDAFRAGRVDSRHYGFLLVPEVEKLLQGGKESSSLSASTEAARQDMAAAFVEEMRPGTLYLLGSGTTLRSVAAELGVEKTLLGVDAVVDGQLVGRDLNERGLLELLDRYDDARIVVTPLGGNGFLFGRGNKQFTPAVLRRTGLDNIIVLSTRDKLMKLPALHVDTGDAQLDDALSGYITVVVGHGHRKMMRVE
jgi:predicted polyphosphate/ATP-dependent NAD kinase